MPNKDIGKAVVTIKAVEAIHMGSCEGCMFERIDCDSIRTELLSLGLPYCGFTGCIYIADIK